MSGTPPRATTVCGAFQATAEAFAERPAIRSGDGSVGWTWDEYRRRVEETAAGLSGLSLGAGDRLVCWISNRAEFHLADTAAIHLGAASCPLDPACPLEHAVQIIRDSKARVLVAQASTIDSALWVRARAGSALETIVVIDDTPSASVMSWSELLGCAPREFSLRDELAAVDQSFTVTVIHEPEAAHRGIAITHARLLASLAAMSARLTLPEGSWTVSLQSMAHAAERLWTHYLPIVHGWSVITGLQPHELAVTPASPRPEPPHLWDERRAEVFEFWDRLGVPLAEAVGAEMLR